MLDVQDAFNLMRPLCVRLTKEFTKDNMMEVTKAFESLPEMCCRELTEYVVFPFRFHLRRLERTDGLVAQLFECLSSILKKAAVDSYSLFSDIFMQVFVKISSPKEDNKILGVSEEVKVSAVKCVHSLVSSCSTSVLQQMYGHSFRVFLGHAVYVLLRLAEQEKFRHLQVIAIETISVLASCHVSKKKVTGKAGATFAAFLPGVCLSLSRVLAGDQKQGHAVFVAALQTWADIVVLVMGDNNQTTDVEDPSVEQIDKSYNVPVVCRTQEWFKDTSQKLVILVRKVTQLVSHEHWKVRSAVVNWATKLLMECKESLKECLSPLLEVLLMVANDDFKEVSSRSIEVLKNFQACYLTTGDQSVLDVLEENFHLLTTKLPRVLRTSDDVGKLQTLKLLCGYLLLFGPSVCHLLQSLPHLERLMISLLQLAELDCSDVRMLEETALPVESCGTETALPRWPKKSFKYFFDTQIEECLVQICRLLGYYGDPSLLIDYLLDKLHESSVYCKQAILIINQILLGWKGIEVSKKDIFCERSADQKEAEIEDLVKCIIEEYTCETLWEVPLSNSQETTVSLMLHHSPERASLTVERLNSNILQCCLLLEGVTACSEVLGQNFRPFLVTVLCPVMEKAGSNCGLVSHTAHVALHFMSFHCHYSSVADIIAQNADYLVNILSLKLRHFTENPGIPVVLKVVLQKCDRSILLLVQDMVSEVLCALDYFHNVQSLPLVRVMLEVMNAIQRWFPAQPEDISSRSPVLPPSQRVKKFLLDYLHNKQLAETFSDEDDESIENPDGRSSEINGYFNDDEKKPEKPLHVRMVLDILQRCVHLQASNNIWVHLLVLDMISVGVVVLKQHQDDLLPMVHQLWKPFVQQFSNDVTVMIKAFETLSAMVSTCGDFIRQRTLQDVWPKLMRFLENQAKISYGKNSGSYQFTGNYKFQLKILSGVGLLAQKLGFQENEVGLLASTLHPYLSCSQPVALQQAALGAFDTLIELDPDVVWLYLISLSSSVNLQPPHPSLCPVQLRGTNDEPECTSNVQYLLQKLGG